MKYQVTLGAGAPSAWQLMVASFPSSAVRLAGGWINTGTDAAQGNIGLNTGREATQETGKMFFFVMTKLYATLVDLFSNRDKACLV